MKNSKSQAIMAAFTFLALFCFLALHAQQPGQPPAVKRTILKQQDLSSVPGHEGVVAQVEFVPGAKEPKHTHPGEVFGYVLEGSVTLYVEGQPAATAKAGEVFFVPAGKVHWGENTGTTTARVVGTFVVEKGKPLTSPAP